MSVCASEHVCLSMCVYQRSIVCSDELFQQIETSFRLLNSAKTFIDIKALLYLISKKMLTNMISSTLIVPQLIDKENIVRKISQNK